MCRLLELRALFAWLSTDADDEDEDADDDDDDEKVVDNELVTADVLLLLLLLLLPEVDVAGPLVIDGAGLSKRWPIFV